VPGTSRWRALAVVGVACAAVALAWVAWRPASGPAATPAPASVPEASPSSAAPQAYGVLVGEWTRPDGG